MELQIEGTLKKKFDITTHGASFRKMEFVIKTEDENYPQLIKMQVTQDKCEKFDELPVGTKAKWFFNLRGRAWENKKGETIYFNSIEVWRYETTGTDLKVEKEVVNTETEADNDELPF
tara:strand:- start:11642 stop:11995 length:354 start_codon:yes stop_codon:yes gene_type:complete